MTRSFRWRLAGRAVLLLGLAWAPPIGAQRTPAAALDEVTSAYLVKFSDYVVWPARAFASDDAPIVIGVIDHPGVARSLERLAQGKRAQERPLQVRLLDAGDRLDGIHILLLPPAGHPARARVTAQARHLPVLTVAPPEAGEDGSNSALPALVRLVLDNDRLRFDVNLPRDKDAVRVSALMLTAARQVHRSVK